MLKDPRHATLAPALAEISVPRRLSRLVEQAAQYQPRWVIATDGAAGTTHDWSGLPRGTEPLPFAIAAVLAGLGVLSWASACWAVTTADGSTVCCARTATPIAATIIKVAAYTRCMADT